MEASPRYGARGFQLSTGVRDPYLAYPTACSRRAGASVNGS